MVKHLKTLLCSLMLVLAISANAQVTTSAISGVVTNEQNEAVIGATVFATHQPSGTQYGATTNLDGRYTIQGMRTGGPYVVTISYIGNKAVTFEKISLELGNTLQLNAKMEPATQQLKEVVVVGTGKKEAGASHNFSLSKIQNAPTVDRNIYDVVKNMPMVNTSKIGGISIAGANNRYNSFQIDGTVSNDVFGLAGSGTNGGQTSANPISMDAIQEIQVVVAPFDVRQSGFTGGGINAITKQGNNDYHASFYTYYTNQDLYGTHDAYRDYLYSPLGKQHTTTIGGTLSGPIIKDKLFFFLNAENQNESYPTSYYAGYTDTYINADVAKQITDQYYKITGIQESFNRRNIDRKALSLLGRIDWNINQSNKLAFRYQFNNSSKDVLASSSGTLFMNGSGYTMKNKTNSFVVELNSRIGNNLFNEARVSASYVRDNRATDYQGPTVLIQNVVTGYDSDGKGIRKNVQIGTEYSSGANHLNQDVYTIEDNLSWYKGKHTFTFGTHNEIYKMDNLFIQANNGDWRFGSLDNFMNGVANRIRFNYSDGTVTGGNLLYAPTIKAGQFGIYAQDKWEVTNNLQLTLGLRLDIPTLFNSPTTNDAYNEFAYQKEQAGVEGFADSRTGVTPQIQLMVSPRIGFRWFVDDSHNTLLRGGVGLFTGRVPFVWMSNAYTNCGVEQKGINTTYGLPAFDSHYATTPMDLVSALKGSTPAIVTLDKKFRTPQVFRANLALEQNLPYDIKMTLEGLYSKTFNNISFQNLALEQDGSTYAVPGVKASAVPHYKQNNTDYYSIIHTTNTNKGYTYSLSAMFEKDWWFGLNASASYTFGHSKGIHDGTSSVAYSNWSYLYSKDSNNPGLAYTYFDVPHKVMLSVGYTTPKYANGLLRSTISVIYNGNNGMRYSYTYNSNGKDFNGDKAYGNELLYIPTASELEQMTFTATKNDNGTVIATAEENKAAFAEFCATDKYAKGHRGQYAERNGCNAPWENRIDLHFAQDFFVLKQRGSKLQFTFDIINFANMLYYKWGNSYSSTYNVTPLQVSGVTGADGVYTPTYSYYYDSDKVKKNNIFSRWNAQVGFKLIF